MNIEDLQINADMDHLQKQARHPGPVFTGVNYGGDSPVAIQWIPAFAGMTLLYRT